MVMTDTNFRQSLLPGKHELKPPPTPEKRTKQKPRICLEKARFCWRQREERESTKMLLSIMDLLFHWDRYLLCYRAQLSDIYFPMGFSRRENLVSHLNKSFVYNKMDKKGKLIYIHIKREKNKYRNIQSKSYIFNKQFKIRYKIFLHQFQL